ncbi:hypothetical protein NF27_HL00110 [Candidatus Jidaibacter acanthamoeba]|uniref:Resolvase HTH domain-containing protein n=1 Tax=Candidatus Jidaibacter acanthamoebae TaxID=86105 RepID=A0A0C1MXD4_9RICK|nr:helix-turn-helix domain-containing protein [Candidatus Jidaibacter acanthamoeba]KIE04546.1 hypothetical protein NF27_HL00110 [Candidatus Jidaibacter acanthamoeba]
MKEINCEKVFIEKASGAQHERPELKAAHLLGRKGGRPPALTQKDLAEARALLRDPKITVEDAARRLQISPATLYRHLPGGRSSV